MAEGEDKLNTLLTSAMEIKTQLWILILVVTY